MRDQRKPNSFYFHLKPYMSSPYSIFLLLMQQLQQNPISSFFDLLGITITIVDFILVFVLGASFFCQDPVWKYLYLIFDFWTGLNLARNELKTILCIGL
jgi:hypothetical protein